MIEPHRQLTCQRTLTPPRKWLVPAARFPITFTPMQPELAPEPFQRPGWIYEEKFDGWRIVAYKDGQGPSQEV